MSGTQEPDRILQGACPDDLVSHRPQPQASAEDQGGGQGLASVCLGEQWYTIGTSPSGAGHLGGNAVISSLPHPLLSPALQLVSIDVGLEEEGYCQLWLNVIARGV